MSAFGKQSLASPNRAAVIRIVTKISGDDKAAFSYAYDFLQKGNGWTLNDGMDSSSLLYTAGQMLSFKEIDKLPTYSQIVDGSYIDAVLVKLGGVKE